MTYRSQAAEEARALLASGPLWPLDEWPRITLIVNWRSLLRRYGNQPLEPWRGR
jgi:hypothetical protein